MVKIHYTADMLWRHLFNARPNHQTMYDVGWGDELCIDNCCCVCSVWRREVEEQRSADGLSLSWVCQHSDHEIYVLITVTIFHCVIIIITLFDLSVFYYSLWSIYLLLLSLIYLSFSTLIDLSIFCYSLWSIYLLLLSLIYLSFVTLFDLSIFYYSLWSIYLLLLSLIYLSFLTLFDLSIFYLW